MDNIKIKTQSSLKISEEVISAIVKNSLGEIAGVDSLVALPPKYNVAAAASAKPINVRYNGDVVEISIALVLSMNHKIKPVCEQAQQAVKDSVQNMAGVTVSKVNIYVRGVNVSVEQ